MHQEPILVVFWTLCYEVAFYGVVSVLLVVGRRLSERLMLNCLHLVTVLSLLHLILFTDHRVFPFDLWPQFGLGVLVYDVLAHRQKAARLLGSLIIVGIVAFAVLHNYGSHLGQQGSRGQFLFSLAFAFLLIAMAHYDHFLERMRVVRLLSWVGLFSYSLYLTHLLMLGIVLQIAKRFSESQSLYVVSFLLQISAAVFAAYFFYLGCEKPFLNKRAGSLNKRTGSCSLEPGPASIQHDAGRAS